MPRAGLDSATVVRAATAIADADGLAAVTLARLAGQLGVRPPSLYAHVDGLPDLLARIGADGALALAGVLEAAAAGRSGSDALYAVGLAYRAFAGSHPGSYEALQRAAPAGSDAASAGERVVGVVLAVLRGYGCTGEDALHAVRVIRSALHGFVVLENGGGFGLPLSLDETFERLVAVLDRGLASR
jgi:AcrR family transcriptional regulator